MRINRGIATRVEKKIHHMATPLKYNQEETGHAKQKTHGNKQQPATSQHIYS